MFTTDDLQELVEFRSTGAPVLSVYLNVDPTQHTTEEYRLALKGLLKEAGDEAAPEDIAEWYSPARKRASGEPTPWQCQCQTVCTLARSPTLDP